MKKTATKKKAVKTKPAAKRKAEKKPAAAVAAKALVAARAVTPMTDKLIGKGEPPACRVENAKGAGRCVIVCDHASNLVPKSLNDLGLSRTDLQKHIAWDPGTEDIGRRLSKLLDAPAVYASYSRLVVDLNRGPDAPECMRDVSDHIRIPGNVELPQSHKSARLTEFFWPYHREVDTQLQRFLNKGTAPVLISLHSFTPRMDGFKRPWHIGVLWNKEEGIARKLIESLRKNHPEFRVGENEPYSLKSANFVKNTVSTHAESRGLPYVIVEFRQDLVNTPAKAVRWADIFYKSLKPVLADPALYRLRQYRA